MKRYDLVHFRKTVTHKPNTGWEDFTKVEMWIDFYRKDLFGRLRHCQRWRLSGDEYPLPTKEGNTYRFKLQRYQIETNRLEVHERERWLNAD